MLYCWREKGWESNGVLIALVRRQSALGFYRKKETVSSLNLAQKRQRHKQRGIESVLGFNRVCVRERGGGEVGGQRQTDTDTNRGLLPGF